MKRTTKADPVIILRRLKRELQDSIRLLEKCRDPRARGQWEALVYIERFLDDGQPLPPRRQVTTP